MLMVDVAIVGAGPAGAWAACQLARRGARVMVFDPSHPREKPCGGGVTGRALALVGDAIDRGTVPCVAIRTARFTRVLSHGLQERDRSAVVSLRPGALVVAGRTAFDAALLDSAVRAGATLQRARVVDVEADGTGVSIRTREGTCRAGFLIGADGANSLVRRRFAAPFQRRQLSTATGFFAHGATSDEIVIEITAEPSGYIWSFPRPDHLAIGICAQADAGATPDVLRRRTRNWIDAAGVAPAARLATYAWPIPSLGAGDFGALVTGGPRWCLAGDAAGLVDPITREGIFYAIASGGWAADAASSNGAAAAATYAARVHEEAGAELARAARLKAGFFRPAFASLMVHALQESAAVRSVMADLVAGEQSYRTLKWRLIRTFEVELAWRAWQGRNVKV
jgi:geranylgeranyl reductase family protein